MFLMRTVFLEYTTHKHPRSRAYMKHIRLPEDDSFKHSSEMKRCPYFEVNLMRFCA
jgi:hypothetical protein